MAETIREPPGEAEEPRPLAPQPAGARLLTMATVGLAVAWTVAVGGSVAAGRQRQALAVLESARLEARSSLQKDVLYQRWVMDLGGVYARVTAETPTNPCLPHGVAPGTRTARGEALTLVNPAYMERLVHSVGQKLGIPASHRTGIGPIRSGNAADAWETEALRRVAGGDPEYSSVERIGDRPHLRFLRSTPLGEGCLRCHGAAENRDASISTGLSLAVDLAPYLQSASKHNRQDLASHAALWLLGLSGLAGGRWFVGRRIQERTRQQSRDAEVIRRLNRLYATLSQLDRSILRLRSRDELLREVCRVGVATGGFERVGIVRLEGPPAELVWIAVADARGAVLAPARKPDGDLPIPSLVEACLRTGRTCLHGEGPAGPPSAPEDGNDPGSAYRAGAALPLRLRGKVWGALSVEAGEAGVLGNREVAMLEEIAEDLASGLERLGEAEERRSLDEALRLSEANLRTLVEHIPHRVFIKDTRSRYVFVNQNYARDLGLAPEAVVGRIDFDFFPEALARQYRADDQRILAAGRMEDLVEPYDQAGRRIWIHTVKTPVRDMAGAVVGVCGIFRDITAQRTSESLRGVLLKLATDLSAAQTQAEATQRVLSAADEFWQWDACTLDLYRPGGEILEPLICMDRLDGERRMVTPPESGDQPTPRMRRILARGPELILRENPRDAISDSIPFGDTTRLSASIMGVPLRSGGRVIGVLTLQSYTTNAFTREDLQTLQALADHCGGALERIHGEVALRQSEERFRTLLQDVPSVAIQGYAPDGTTQYWNHASERLYGYSATEAVGRSLLDLIIPPEMRSGVREAMQWMAANSRAIPPGELSLQRKDGTRVPVYSSHALVRLPGHRSELFCIDIDLSEQKRTEAALRRRGRILEAVSFAAERFLRDPDWRRSLPQVLGRLGEATGVSRAVLWQTHPETEGECCISHTLEWAAEGIPPRLDDPTLSNFALRANGFGRWEEILSRGGILQGNVRDFPPAEQGPLTFHHIRSIVVVPVMVSGRWWGFLALDECFAERSWEAEEVEVLQTAASILGEAVERQAAEQALRWVTRQMELILDSAGEGIMGLDLQGRPTFVNPAAARMLGYDQNGLVASPGNPTGHRAPADGQPDPQEEMPFLHPLRDGKVHRRNDEVFRRKDGTSFPVDYISTPILEEGRVVGAVVAFTDITARKQLEAQLRQAQKLEAIGQLAGGVAHDFNNILASSLLNLEMMLQTASLGPQLRASLEDLESDTRRAADLTRQLLLFSRRSVMRIEDLDVNAVVDNLLRMLRRLIGEPITLDWRAGAALPAVSGDVGMIEQVVVNLIVNARDAMPHGGRVTLATRLVEVTDEEVQNNPEARRGRFVCLSVEDTGCGMDAALIKRIFEPFFTTKPPGEGSGLGLATVYGVTKQHGGWVTVVSEVGRGSVFHVHLPALAERARETPVAPASRRPASGNETILLVEDEPALRLVLRGFLQRCGYRVIEAVDGPDAEQAWARHRDEIDLLFTDMVMPGEMTGLQLADRLRVTRPTLKVLVSSGYSAELGRQSNLAGKRIVFLPKPCDAYEMARAVRDCLDETAG